MEKEAGPKANDYYWSKSLIVLGTLTWTYDRLTTTNYATTSHNGNAYDDALAANDDASAAYDDASAAYDDASATHDDASATHDDALTGMKG